MSRDQAITAAWMGYTGPDAVDRMNMHHDVIHGWLCMSLGVPSYALADGRGEPLTDDQRRLAALEEVAVLHVQRLRQMSRRILDGDAPPDIETDVSGSRMADK